MRQRKVFNWPMSLDLGQNILRICTAGTFGGLSMMAGGVKVCIFRHVAPCFQFVKEVYNLQIVTNTVKPHRWASD